MSGVSGRGGALGSPRLARRGGRGRLKVYLGYAPGVGTTYQMLLEGHRLLVQEVDVVIGYVESHGRPDTQSLCIGLEEVPRRVVDYHGIRVEEMDVAAVLARGPSVVLVDELAHANAPGSRHDRRWQDVLEILDAGINVLTTVTVQQLEGLYETVRELVGVTVTERVPDWLLGEAEQLVNVDLAVEDLRQRLEQGKVYPRERIDSTLAGLFAPEKLAQLRELALREAAARAQRPGGGPRQAPAIFSPDQVMVCLSSKGPAAEALLRYGSRLAGRLDRNWIAVYVQTRDEEPERLEPVTRRRIAETLELARRLGATVFTYRGDEVVSTLLRFAREYGIGHVVMGSPGRRTWRDRVRGRAGPVHELLERATGLTVVVVDAKGGPVSASPLPGAAPSTVTSRDVDGGRPRAADPLQAEAIIFVPGSPAPEELIERLVEVLVRLRPELDGATALSRLLIREREGSTFIESGVGLPHARLPDLPGALAALAVCPEATPGAPRVTLLLLLPEDDPDQALGLLGSAARLFRRDAVIDALVTAADGGEALRVWRTASAR